MVIEIKKINEELYLSLDDKVEFNVLIEALNERMELLKERGDDTLILNLYLGYRLISSQELFELINLIIEDKKILIKKIDVKSEKGEVIETYDKKIRGGEDLLFKNKVLILGDINPSGKVVAYKDVYVVGKILGKVEVKKKNAKIVASSFKNASLRIADVFLNSVTIDHYEKFDYLKLKGECLNV